MAVERNNKLVKGFALKSLCVQVTTPETTLMLQIRELTPVGGLLEITNVGAATTSGVITVKFFGEGEHVRTLATDIIKLKPGESDSLKLGIMMPGCIGIEMGKDYDSSSELIRLPSPGGQCIKEDVPAEAVAAK